MCDIRIRKREKNVVWMLEGNKNLGIINFSPLIVVITFTNGEFSMRHAGALKHLRRFYRLFKSHKI